MISSLKTAARKPPAVLARTLLDRSKMLFYRIFGIRYPVRKIQNFEMILDCEDRGLSHQLLKYEVREPDHKFLIERELKPGMTVLDCGANIGYYALMMGKQVGDSGRIIAVEPSPNNYHHLSLNVILNHMEHVIETRHMGVSNESSMGQLFLSKHSNCHTFHPPSQATQEATTGRSIPIPLRSIPDIVEEFGKFDFLRMDTEGFEVEILEGLVRALEDESFRPTLFFETHPGSYDEQHDFCKPMRDLFAHGYEVSHVVANFASTTGGAEFARRGYGPDHVIATFTVNDDRAIYVNVTNDDALDLAQTDLVRALLMSCDSRKSGTS